MQTTIILLLFALGGAFKGIADAVGVVQIRIAKIELFEKKTLLKRIEDINFGAIRLGWFLDFPCDSWHLAITLHYAFLAVGSWLVVVLPTEIWFTIFNLNLTNQFVLFAIGWIIVRPIFQNSVQDSLLKNKLVFRFW